MRGVIIASIIIGSIGIALLINSSKNNQPQAIPASPLPSSTTMQKSYSQPPQMKIDPKVTYQAMMATSLGNMTIGLFAQDAPQAVNNFVFLSQEKFYDGTTFHRIIKDFMVQGGDPEGNGRGGPGYSFADEPITREYTRGTVAMANSGPNTNGSQFFIMTKDTPLPKNYVIFGQIIGEESFATLDKIAATPVSANLSGEMSQPQQKVTVTTITIEEK